MTTQDLTSFSWEKSDWTPLSEMADGFDEYRPPLSRALVGHRVELHCRSVDGEAEFTLIHEFGAGTLRWTLQEAASTTAGIEDYELFEMQPGLFFLHYLRSGEDHPVAVTMALDTTIGQATGAVGELGLEPDPHLARQHWFQGHVEGSGATAAGAHQPTAELLGHRIRYAYSSDDVYDHVYLTRQLFTWLCVGGAEAGLGDTDRATYWKLAEQTYLFSWLEKNVGVEGMVLIDLGARRTVGIQFGLDQRTGALVNLTMGAYAQDLGRAPSLAECLPSPT
jgi:hypothetical protein